jgi:hypothetical protein
MSFAKNLLPQIKKVSSEKITLKRSSAGLPTDDGIAIELQRKSENTPD